MFDIKNLNDEYFGNLDQKEILDIKSLSIEDKIQCFKFFLTSDIITNVSVIANIYMVLTGVTSIAEDTFNDNKIFFNSLEEYIDIKIAIKNELKQFKIKLIEYYLGVIEGLNVQSPDLKIHITNTHFHILHIIKLQTISKIMMECIQNITLQNIKPVFSADVIYNKINATNTLTMSFIQSIMTEVINKS